MKKYDIIGCGNGKTRIDSPSGYIEANSEDEALEIFATEAAEKYQVEKSHIYDNFVAQERSLNK